MKMNLKCALMCVVAASAMIGAKTAAGATETDNRIESSFKTSYVNRVYLKDDAVKTQVKDGVVTLTGTVAETGHKELAEETAANLPGVVRVDNQLETTDEVAVDKSDLWIGRKAKFALLFRRNVDAGNTTIEVKEGIVTLTGEADSAAQKELTAAYVGDINGVKEVKNEMTVATPKAPVERTEGEKLDDASITAQVKTALKDHYSTSEANTKVVTREGEVTLTGIARNDAEKSLISKFVDDIQGVTSVKNQMTVEAIKKM